MRYCKVDGCSGQAVGRDLCWTHYSRLRRKGDVQASISTRSERSGWLDAHTMHEGQDCLIWPYTRSKTGYGPSRKMAILALGAPPSPRHQAAHSCGKGHLGCVNPRHLYWATPEENGRDRVVHGTVVRGSAAHNSLLTDEQVMQIKAELSGPRRWGLNRKLAMKYGVHEATICDIKNGRRWSHIVLVLTPKSA